MPEEFVKISLYLTKETRILIRGEARRKGQTGGEVINDLLRAKLHVPPDEPPLKIDPQSPPIDRRWSTAWQSGIWA
jgi:hypothetical protein